MITRHNQSIAVTSARGFSMIDVLVAIVVLGTALLALAALQGALTRNGADARARSQIAAYTDGLIDQMRSGGYSSLSSGTVTITPLCTSVATKRQIEACNAQNAAGVTNLQTTITTTTWYSDPDTGVFGGTKPATVMGTYDQVNVLTTWTDSSGTPRQLSTDTIISPVQIDQNNNALASTTLLPALGSTPIVRQYNPGLTAGVIPIAMGDSSGSQTAATNPQPEILGKNNNQFIGGVSYNVLTFGQEDDASTHATQITQNIATRVIRCSCKYGAGLTDVSDVFTQPYRPTYWDASQKKYVTPAKASSATSDTGEDPDATQDTNCNICCRDRNDFGTTGEIRFNPWNPDDNSHYRYEKSGDTVPVEVLSSDHDNAFINACRLIIVDGQFRVATDMQNYFFGLVPTDNANSQGVPSGSTSTETASSPLPTKDGSDDYQSFVVDYLTKITGAEDITTATVLTDVNYPLNGASSPSSGNDAADLYEKAGLSSNGTSVPSNIDITYVDPGKNKTASCIPSGTQDCRYLHARGLYLDYLEPVTLTAINNALSTCSSNNAIQGCLFPLLPFTTINITQLAYWSEQKVSPVDITVSNTALTGGDADQPLRGVVSALSTGKNNTTQNAVATIGLSNSGIIGTLTQAGISPTDASTTLSTEQQFTMTNGGGGGSSNSLLEFNIVLSGGAISSGTNTPSVGWAGDSTYYTSGSAVTTKPCPSGSSPSITVSYVGSSSNNCNNPTPNEATASGLPSGSTGGVQVVLQNYNVSTPGTGGTDAGCTTTTGSGKNKVIVQPTKTTCSVYSVSGVSVGTTPVSGWTSTLSATGTNSIYGLSATSTVKVPSGLSSSDAANPDKLNITLAIDGTHSYTKDFTCTPVGCTGTGGNKCTFIPGTCDP